MVVLSRIEALPGTGRYVVTFARADGSEQSAVVEVNGADVQAAEASLPTGWTLNSESFAGVAAAVRAFDAARQAAAAGPALRDVEGGWDVGLGNVVLNVNGLPACTAHGPMDEVGGEFVCAECGARAVLR